MKITENEAEAAAQAVAIQSVDVAGGDLRLKTGPAEGWISQLLSIDAAEEQLNMVVAFEKKENGPVGYWLCRLNLQTREVAPVAQLLDPWC